MPSLNYSGSHESLQHLPIGQRCKLSYSFWQIVERARMNELKGESNFSKAQSFELAKNRVVTDPERDYDH